MRIGIAIEPLIAIAEKSPENVCLGYWNLRPYHRLLWQAQIDTRQRREALQPTSRERNTADRPSGQRTAELHAGNVGTKRHAAIGA